MLPTTKQIAESLYEFIKHGDDAHKAWLKDKSLEWVKAYLSEYFLDGEE